MLYAHDLVANRDYYSIDPNYEVLWILQIEKKIGLLLNQNPDLHKKIIWDL